MTRSLEKSNHALDEIARYGSRMQQGMSEILNECGIAHVFTGHPSMGGLFFAESAPRNYRDWKKTDYSFYDAMAVHLHDLGIPCELDSREPRFICAAHDDACLDETLEKFETAADATREQLGR